MNSCEPESPAPDDDLCRALQSLPIPEPPPGVASRVRGRILRRRARRTAVALAAAGLAGLLAWQPWAEKAPVPPPVHHQPGLVAKSVPPQIPADALDVLFAPPPVDSLAILARRDQLSIGALNRLEGVK